MVVLQQHKYYNSNIGISNLPKINTLLLPKEYELLPNNSEIFELEFAYEEMAINNGFVLDQKIVKPIKGIQNTMKDEYILFLRKYEVKLC